MSYIVSKPIETEVKKVVAFISLISILGISSLLSLLGVTEAVHIPRGW